MGGTGVKRRKWGIALLLVLALQAAVILWFGGRKQGYFIDELYSFGLSNGYYKPFITSYEEIFQHWEKGDLIHDYLTVQEGERFAYDSVIYNQSQDVHPPVYYMLLHTISSFFTDQYSKWLGIGLNLAAFLGCGYVLWKLGKLVFGEGAAALAPVVIWGFSAGAVSYTLYIRMYMVLTLFTLLSAWLHVRMVRLGQTPLRLAVVLGVTLCGLLTQYYFVIFAFYLSAAYGIWKLLRGRYREGILYGAGMFGAVGGAVLLFPACVAQLTRQDEIVARETRNNIGNLAVLKENLLCYCYGINTDFLAGKYLAFLGLVAAGAVVVAVIMIMKGRRRSFYKGEADTDSKEGEAEVVPGLLILSGCLGTVLTIGAVAVVPSPRYICSMYPLMVWIGVWIVWLLLRREEGVLRGTLACLMAVMLVGGVVSWQAGLVQYLYQDEGQRLAVLREREDLPCIYVTNYRVAALTADLRELEHTDEFYVTDEPGLDSIADILDDRDTSGGILVIVDDNEYWGSGYEGEAVLGKIIEKMEFTEYEQLFQKELSSAYYVK